MVHTALEVLVSLLRTGRRVSGMVPCPALGERPSDRRSGFGATEAAGWSQIVGRPEIRRNSGSTPKEESVVVKPAAVSPVAMPLRSVAGDFLKRRLIAVAVRWNGLYQHTA